MVWRECHTQSRDNPGALNKGSHAHELSEKVCQLVHGQGWTTPYSRGISRQLIGREL